MVDGGGRDEADRNVEGEEFHAADVDEQVKAGGEIGEEAGVRKALPSPYMPTISEIRHHKTTHLPYRSWCDECVEAFAREWPHLRGENPNRRSIPIIHMDYAYLTEKGLFKVEDLTEEERKHGVQAIVMYDGGSGSPFMHVVPSKGTTDNKYAAEKIVEDIIYLGHTRVVLRSDNEPALVQLVSDALKGLRIQHIESAAAEGSVPYDPQTAGAAEVAVRNMKAQVRATHLTLDRFLGNMCQWGTH